MVRAMSRIRTVKPDFWGDPKTSRVSRDARLLFLGLLNESDDEGRQLGSPRRLAGVLFPHDDDVSTAHIKRWLDELETQKFIRRYQADGTAYVLICGFLKHQAINRPTASRFPSPPESSVSPHGAVTEDSPPDLGNGSGTGNREVEVIAPAARKVDPLWDAVMESCGIGSDIPENARGRYNKAVKLLRDVGADPGEVPKRAAMHRMHWHDIKLTPMSLASHWAECTPDAKNLAGQTVPKGFAALARVMEARNDSR